MPSPFSTTTRFFTGLRAAALACSMLMLHPSADAQTAPAPPADYPTRQVRLVVPYPPGGINDTIGRVIANRLGDKWKQPVIVENRGGASGAIGADVVMRSPPDGYTLLLANSSMLLSSLTEPQLNLDLLRNFTPVSLVGTSALALVVSSGMGVESMAGFSAAMKAAPARYSYGTTGAGSSSHLYAERLARRLDARPVHVPYGGASPMLTELLANRIDFAFLDQVAMRQHVEAGKLKAIALTGTQRSAVFPTMPTFTEAGIPGFEMTSWLGLYGPRGMPAATVQQIAGDLADVLRQPDLVARFAELGTAARTTTADEFGRIVANHRDTWASMIREANLQTK